MDSGKGKVYLVGGGPGDPGLITVKGLRLLQQADVVVYDRLVDARLLEHARKDAERIYVGKGPDQHAMSQQDINRLLVDRACRTVKSVVRLKGGDPFVFGRGGEEALALAEAGSGLRGGARRHVGGGRARLCGSSRHPPGHSEQCHHSQRQ